MGFSASNPSYIYQTPSGYIIRLRVPADVKPVVGRVEFRYSFRAGALRVAKYRARCIASFIQQLIEKVRKKMEEYIPEQVLEIIKKFVEDVVNGEAPASPKISIDGETVLEPSYLQASNGRVVLSPKRIKQLVIEYMRETLEHDEKCRALTGGGTISLDGITLLESSNMKADESRAILQSVSRWLSQGDHSLMHSLTEKIMTRENVDIDPLSETYKVMSRELLKAFQSVLQVRIRRSEGDYSAPDEELVPVLKQVVQRQEAQAPLPVVNEPVSLPFTEIQERYITEVEKGENWTEKTKAENLSIFALFVRAMGDLVITKIDRKLISESVRITG